MKTKILVRVCSALISVVYVLSGTSCMTTYDAQGRPMQTVDPGLATAGVVAAGLAGYAIGQNNNSYHRYGGGGYYGYGGGYYRPYACY